MNKLLLIGMMSVTLASTLFFCNPTDSEETTETCTPADSKVVELTSDISGKTYSVGDEVTLTWKVDGNSITQVMIDVSRDNGKNWFPIPQNGPEVPTNSRYQCMSYVWKIGSENEDVGYTQGSNTCTLRLHQYSDNSKGVVFSDKKFTINKP